MKTITLLSGKGGTGKSSITASLAVLLSKKKRIICADCDIDASNLALVFGKQEVDFDEWVDLSTIQKVEFDHDKCISCGKCFESCYFQAIDFQNKKPKLNEFGCEGCGACEIVCPVNAIKLVDVNNAKIGYVKTKYNFKIVSAQLEIGKSGSGKVVSEVKNKAKQLSGNSEIMLVDSAAGVSCPVIAAVTNSNYCVLIAEPTPSGLFDMKKAYEIVKNFNIPAGLIINKTDLNIKYHEKIKKFANNNGIKVLGELPYDKVFSDALVNMIPVVEKSDKQKKLFSQILTNLLVDCNF